MDGRAGRLTINPGYDALGMEWDATTVTYVWSTSRYGMEKVLKQPGGLEPASLALHARPQPVPGPDVGWVPT